MSALKRLEHPNIVKLLDILLKDEVLFLVFEFIEKDLRGYLEPFVNVGLDYTMAKRYLYQLVDAIAYCHCKQMLHRDLKPSNLLIDPSGTLKLADFGMARTICVRARPYTNAVGVSLAVTTTAVIFMHIPSHLVVYSNITFCRSAGLHVDCHVMVPPTRNFVGRHVLHNICRPLEHRLYFC